jgi:hypothetical protein
MASDDKPVSVPDHHYKFDVSDFHDTLLPDGIFERYGCINCELRHSATCPHFDVDKRFTVFPDTGICDTRKYYLYSLTPRYESKPTLAQWQRDILISLGINRNFKENLIVSTMEKRLEEMQRTNCDSDTISKYEKKLGLAKDRLISLMLKLGNLIDQQVNRETPKKFEHIFERKMTPSDLAEMLRNHRQKMLDDAKTIDVDIDSDTGKVDGDVP